MFLDEDEKVDEIHEFYLDNRQSCYNVSKNVIRHWLKAWSRNKTNIVNKLGLKDNQMTYEFEVEVEGSLGNDNITAYDFCSTIYYMLKEDKQYTAAEIAKDILLSLKGREEAERIIRESDYSSIALIMRDALSKDYKYITTINRKGNPEKMKVMRWVKSFDITTEKSLQIIDKAYSELLSTKVTTKKETVVISIDPIDYIQASYNTSGGWRSCFALDGEYHASTNAYLRTEDVAICYILDRDGKKKHRQWIMIGNDYFSKGRSYPNENKEMNKTITKHLKSLYKQGRFFSYHKEHNVLLGSDGTYIDSFNTWYYKDNKPEYIDLYDGENCEGDSPYDCGYFSNEENVYCEVCDSRVPEDALHWSEYHEMNICDCCLEDYRWCEDVDSYVHIDEAYYLDDRGYWVSDDYGDRLYCEDEGISIDGSYTDYVEDYCNDYSFATLEHAQRYWYYIEDEDAYTVDNSSLYTDEDGNYYYYEENVPKMEEN